MATGVQIRQEEPTDRIAVRQVIEAAFGTSAEATLVELLRAEATPLVSLVAEHHGEIVGHVLFSPVTLATAPRLPLMGLAPMAVVPAWQRRGIGTALATRGLDACARLGARAVVVLGHPAYYPRFGFVPASRFGLTCEYDVPDEVFMAMELKAHALSGRAGMIRYHAVFTRV